jgi:rhomboid protease GluP
MANIRGFGDIRNEAIRGGNGNPAGNPGGDPNPGDSQAIYRLLGFERSDQNKDPREETFLEMLHYNFCPTLRFKSLTGILVPTLIGIFILSLIVNGVNREGEFLQVNGGPMYDPFTQNGYKIRVDRQYWRLITAIFFHLSFTHIIMNCISMLIWGSFIESFLGTRKYAVIYFVSGITGNLLSVMCHNGLYYDSVGASGCIMGTIGALIGMLILNWLALGEGQYKEARSTLTCIVIILTVFALLFTLAPTSPNQSKQIVTDNWAHFGGLLGGFFISMAIGRVFGRSDTTYEKRVRMVGWVLLAGLVFGTAIPMIAVIPYH